MVREIFLLTVRRKSKSMPFLVICSPWKSLYTMTHFWSFIRISIAQLDQIFHEESVNISAWPRNYSLICGGFILKIEKPHVCHFVEYTPKCRIHDLEPSKDGITRKKKMWRGQSLNEEKNIFVMPPLLSSQLSTTKEVPHWVLYSDAHQSVLFQLVYFRFVHFTRPMGSHDV